MCKSSSTPLVCFLVLLLLTGGSQNACFLKFWGGDDNPEEEIHDVKGTVQSMTKTQLVVQTEEAVQEFVLTDASIRGQEDDYDTGTLVHVYYKIRDNVREVTMVVEIID